MNTADQDKIEFFEINWKSLFLYPLYHWKGVLAGALIIIFLGCGLFGFSSYRKTHNKSEEKTQEIETSADGELQEYLKKKDEIETEIEYYENAMEAQKQYIAHSIRIQIDPYKAWHARFSAYVDTDYKIMPELTYQNQDRTPIIANALCDMLNNSELKSRIAESQDMNIPQLDELLTIYVGSYNSIVIDVIADTESRAAAIMNMLQEELHAGENQLQTSFGDFNIKETLSTCNEEVDRDILNEKNNLLNLMRENRETIMKLQTELKLLEEPTSSTVKTVKNVVLLLVVALFIPYGCFCFKFLMSDRFYTPKELDQRWNINALGSVQLETKHDLLVKWARVLEDRTMIPTSEAYALAAHNIQNRCEDKTNILVVGDAPCEICKLVTDRVQENLPNLKLQCFGSLLTSAESAAALGKCDGVVLIEQCSISKNSHIRQEIKQIADLKKPLIGCVVVDL